MYYQDLGSTNERRDERRNFHEGDLFKLTVKKKWKQVVEIYKKYPDAHKTKLTKSNETVFHIAISRSCESHITEMIGLMEEKGSLIDVLSMQNVRGNNPLHLAAAVGCAAICERVALKHWELISIRNEHGETPLFIAGHYGNLQAFLCLHELYNDKKDQQAQPAESLCRRKDGNTVLHSAISGEYFSLAYQIIEYYEKLVNSVNADGETPLHVLARKPNVFKSSRELGFYDSIIDHCVFVKKLKKQKYNPKASQNGHSHRSGTKFPRNYTTCVNIFFLSLESNLQEFSSWLSKLQEMKWRSN